MTGQSQLSLLMFTRPSTGPRIRQTPLNDNESQSQKGLQISYQLNYIKTKIYIFIYCTNLYKLYRF